jgi:predicted PurR-regulated permease PerM
MENLTSKQKNYKVLMTLLSWIFLIVGALFYIIPNHVIGIFNIISNRTGYFQLLPPSSEKFYLDLAVAYMACVTAIAYMISRDVIRNINLTPVLIVGKTTSSLLSLISFILFQKSLLYLSNFIVDGAIVLIVLVFYLPVKKELQLK